MRLRFNGLLYLVAIWSASGLEISHQDLEDPNGTLCGPSGVCDNSILRNDSTTIRNCRCDKNCEKYGDCCLSSTYTNDAVQRRATNSFVCKKVHHYALKYKHVYMKTDCPAFWPNTEIRRKCEKSLTQTTDDPLLMTPVTSFDTNTTYGNVYCAVCNKDMQIRYWSMKTINCIQDNTTTVLADEENVTKSMIYDEEENRWQIVSNQKYYKCDLAATLTRSLESSVRQCVPTIKTCPATWDKNDIRQKCESYTLQVYKNSYPPESFRNIHCAICNSVPVQNVSCQKEKESTEEEINVRFFDGTILPFTTIIDFSQVASVCWRPNCLGTYFTYDPFLRSCRSPVLDKSFPVEENVADEIDMGNCSEIVLSEDEFQVMSDKNVYLTQNGLILKRGQFLHHDNKLVIIDDHNINRTTHVHRISYPQYHRYVTLIGIGISIICLSVHLIAFTFVKQFHNLSGKNLASFCVALLLAYCSFTLMDVLRGRACFLNSILTFYFFLAAFAWMLIMSFDVWRMLRVATKELRVNSGQQWRKFFIYSFCGWILPAKIVLVAVVVDICPIGIVPEHFKPHFGLTACWFGQGFSALVFFGIPIMLVLICNLIFFLSSTYMIYSTQSMTRYSASPGTKRDFRLYARLALLMGLTWITGLIGSVVNNEIIWFLFILSNTFLGLFVFVAFTCRTSVLHAIKNLRGNNILNVPGFGWSMNSSETGDIKSPTESKRTSNSYY